MNVGDVGYCNTLLSDALSIISNSPNPDVRVAIVSNRDPLLMHPIATPTLECVTVRKTSKASSVGSANLDSSIWISITSSVALRVFVTGILRNVALL